MSRLLQVEESSKAGAGVTARDHCNLVSERPNMTTALKLLGDSLCVKQRQIL